MSPEKSVERRRKESRGGAPVGFLEELGEVEAASVLYLRLWCSGEAGRARVTDDFHLFLGEGGGRSGVRALATLVRTIKDHGRRPLMRHHETCRCIGGDEAAFANMVAAALAEDREDAILLATLFMRTDVAMLTVAVAQDYGIALRKIVSRIERDPPAPAPTLPGGVPTIH